MVIGSEKKMFKHLKYYFKHYKDFFKHPILFSNYKVIKEANETIEYMLNNPKSVTFIKGDLFTCIYKVEDTFVEIWTANKWHAYLSYARIVTLDKYGWSWTEEYLWNDALPSMYNRLRFYLTFEKPYIYKPIRKDKSLKDYLDARHEKVED